MRLSTLSAMALGARTTMAYLDTSPFFMFSTSLRLRNSYATDIEQSSKITRSVLGMLSSCPTKNYIIVSQPGVSASDYRSPESTPELTSSLRKAVFSGSLSSLVVSDVVGEPEISTWEQMLVKDCKTSPLEINARQGTIPSFSTSNLIKVTFPGPSAASRSEDMKKNDAFLASVIESLPTDDYTVLYTTSARSSVSNVVTDDEQSTQYEMEHPLFDIPQTELKRDLSSHKRQSDDDVTLVDGPLFDRYQFFTPGVWMGFTATLLLVAILYVGISAIAGLQVTYAAFDKENGPQASRKTQ